MSRVARQKHIRNELWTDDYSLPKENQLIAQIRQPKGNNLHEVEVENATDACLATMPTKFRRNVWVKRGDFVLVEPIEEGEKVKVEIVRVLTPEHIKEYTKANVWPKKFSRKREHEGEEEEEKNSDDSEDSLEEFQNPNRRGGGFHQEEEETTTDESD